MMAPDIHCYYPSFTLPHLTWKHNVIMTPDTHCYYPSISIHYITRTLDILCYDDPRDILLLSFLYTSIVHYILLTLDTHCNDVPRYRLLLPIYILSVFAIPNVAWTHLVITPDTNCYHPSIYYHYLLYLMYPRYTLL